MFQVDDEGLINRRPYVMEVFLIQDKQHDETDRDEHSLEVFVNFELTNNEKKRRIRMKYIRY
jgi:hypothetical protein